MIIAPYAAVIALVLVYLSFRVIKLRRSLKVGVGNGQSPLLERAIGAHANFTEYVPLALLLIYFNELYGTSVLILHLLCSVLLLGRIVHAYGVSQLDENYVFRVSGMAMTFFVLISASVRLLVHSLAS